jgi:hypothetical protein
MVTVAGGLSRLIDDGLAERAKFELVTRETVISRQLTDVLILIVPSGSAGVVNTVKVGKLPGGFGNQQGK